ncbi:MAG: hypothetical protein DI573_14600 [Microbacterium sp.]|uniref:cytochrome b/b6 domain-containing protein n=1 Tax=Microbacterium sp. TaxID=51671 RepID=UPI000DB3AB61|nr:cytochrome b/b6 domain-containing protein [Microbacterium sp.]PZU35948.1 MAG: hypothetical protein DI573_14600 [Microbacterium sp.]
MAATDLAPASASAATRTDLSIPLRHAPTVFPGRHAFTHPAPRHPRRFGPFTAAQWVGASLTTGIALLFAVSMVVLLTRWLVSLEPVSAFLTAYPGEYHLPLSAPVGLPAWIGWQHFFNVFLMVLIIRSGLQVRHEKRPPAYWTPRWNRERKISLTLWSHQALDALWLVNGVVFIALLSVSGQWMRIVPTSWEVFPNALSAALQYVSLDWPTENGWVNYNSLQQLAYFTTVFHFPVMLYFVAFIIAHVALVFATGALRNLNHMYASQDADNWAGFWIFSASIALIVAAVVAVRPVTIGPIARWFGTVSSR